MQAALTGLNTSSPLRAHITSVQCQGREPSLDHCSFTPHPQDQGNHQGIMAAGVACAGQ